MYATIWRILPGPKWLKAILALVLFLAVVYALFEWVFPAIAPYMPFYESDVSVGGDPGC